MFLSRSLQFFSSSISKSIGKKLQKPEEVKVTFITPKGERIEAKGKENESLLDIIFRNDVEIDGAEGFGACEGTLTCSSCHVILKKEDYDKIPNKPDDEEQDILNDLTHDVTKTSRLGCQVFITKELDGIEAKIPALPKDDEHAEKI